MGGRSRRREAPGGGAPFVWVRGCADRPAPRWVCTRARPWTAVQGGSTRACARACSASLHARPRGSAHVRAWGACGVRVCSRPCTLGPAQPARACSSHAARMCPDVPRRVSSARGTRLLRRTQPPARAWGPGVQLSRGGTPRESGGRGWGGEPEGTHPGPRPWGQAGPAGGSLQAWDRGGRWTWGCPSGRVEAPRFDCCPPAPCRRPVPPLCLPG